MLSGAVCLLRTSFVSLRSPICVRCLLSDGLGYFFALAHFTPIVQHMIYTYTIGLKHPVWIARASAPHICLIIRGLPVTCALVSFVCSSDTETCCLHDIWLAISHNIVHCQSGHFNATKTTWNFTLKYPYGFHITIWSQLANCCFGMVGHGWQLIAK